MPQRKFVQPPRGDPFPKLNVLYFPFRARTPIPLTEYFPFRARTPLCRKRVTLDGRRAVAFRGELLAPRHFEEGVTETLGFRSGR